MIAAVSECTSPHSRWLFAVVLLLAAVTWWEPAGSPLAEPDESRYAEIPREMLAAGDLVVPRLNGVPYFEKPPLLYWANAAAFEVFGLTPFSARLPTRLAGAGTVLLLILAVARSRGWAAGLIAAILYQTSLLGFLASRTNLTDGVLTFFFTATVLAARETILRRERPRSWAGMAAFTGVAAAGGFLSKGLIALVLPGAIVVLWAWLAGRRARLLRLVFSPALPVFAALTLPWLALAERRTPGSLQFFLIHEHFQRFATAQARRPGPVYYFVPVLVLGLIPALPFLGAALGRLRRSGPETRDPQDARDTAFYLIWFLTVFVFFSISRSKLPPYIFPAIPAAAALAERGVSSARRPWIVQALLATAFAGALLLVPATRTALRELSLAAILTPALAALVVASWAAVLFAPRTRALAVAAVAAGWGACLLAAVLGWPRIPRSHWNAQLAAAARSAAETRLAAADKTAPIVAYRTYLNGVSWELRSSDAGRRLSGRARAAVPLARREGGDLLDAGALPGALARRPARRA